MLHWYLYLKNLVNFSQDEEGQDLVEYALLLGLIAISSVAAIVLAGGQINALWTAVTTALTNAIGTIPVGGGGA